jgi:hypothetical protein
MKANSKTPSPEIRNSALNIRIYVNKNPGTYRLDEERAIRPDLFTCLAAASPSRRQIGQAARNLCAR